MIKPTIGRIVWYWPTAAERECRPTIYNQPLPAMVCGVWSDTCVNLSISDANGNHFGKTSVTLVQEGDARNTAGGYCEWMPYQLAQAGVKPEGAA